MPKSNRNHHPIHKILIYSSLVIVSLTVIVMFVTATSYLELAVAIILYPLLIYLVFKTFPRGASRVHLQTQPAAIIKPVITTLKQATADITDADRRGFLKLIGAAGVSFFLFSIFSKRAEMPFFGKLTPGTNNPTNSEPTDSYRISEVDDGAITFYGFIKQGGAWFIMQEDTNQGSFRYIKGNSNDFPQSWANRENLKYDYYHNVF